MSANSPKGLDKIYLSDILISVILLGLDRVESYARRYPQTRTSLNRWRVIIEKTRFMSTLEIKKSFSKSYDYVPPRCHVFDITQGHRLIALIDFKTQIFSIDAIMDHARYDRWRCL
jgi:mRNA-degrading endonuclease HigB of HigAB toxin-antitoxin module